MSNRKVRVRFAPSPTGPLHIGGVRTALFNYLFAKKNGGDFILRIEDTDQTRFVPGAEAYITEALEWCGMKIDEGVREGGEYGPYKQSERKDIYLKYSQELIDSGNAYYAFDTPEELDALRNQYETEKKTFTYNAAVRGGLNNSLELSDEEVLRKINNGEAYVVRFKMPENEDIQMKDIIRGNVKVNTSALDDKILFKSDGMPTYHLANVIDDHLMEISHVIRGEEWLPSMPLHVLLYRAFGWTESQPEFAHLPLLLKPTGNGKLSKRDGDKLGFSVFPLLWNAPNGDTASGYREDGFFADAFVNLLALLGWNSGTEQEIFSMDELIQIFSLEKVTKSGARFDPEKAKWFNQQYIRLKSNEELTAKFLPILKEKNIDADKEKVAHIVGMVKERVNFVKELWDQCFFFFEAPTEYDAKVVKKKWKEATPDLLSELKDVWNTLDIFNAVTAKATLEQFMEQKGIGFGQVMNALRLVLVGGSIGPDLLEIADILGKDEVVKRIEAGVATIKK